MDVITLYQYAIYHHLCFFLHKPCDKGKLVTGRYTYIFVNTFQHLLFLCCAVRLGDEQAGVPNGD